MKLFNVSAHRWIRRNRFFKVAKIDNYSEAQGSGVGFRLLILPGVAAFWPMFLRRWTRGLQSLPWKAIHTADW